MSHPVHAGTIMSIAALLVVALAVTHPGPPAQADGKSQLHKGLKWLAAKQAKDGSWSGLNDFYRTSCTAYAGLALLMEGSTLQQGDYAANLRLAVEWFEKNARPNGLLVAPNDVAEEGRSTYTHAMSLLFLASAYDLDEDPERRKRVGKLLDAAVRYATSEVSSRGGWSSIPRRQNRDFDETATSTQMLHALIVAERAEVNMPKGLIEKGVRYLTLATNTEGGIVYSGTGAFRPRGGDGQLAPTAATAAMLVGASPRPEPFAKWVEFTAKTRPIIPIQRGQTESTTLLNVLNAARLANSLGESGHRKLDGAAREVDLLRWANYRTQVFDGLRKTQLADGSWSDPYIGPVFSTSLALIILQLDNNFLPAFGK